MKRELSQHHSVARGCWEAFYRNRSEDSGACDPNALLIFDLVTAQYLQSPVAAPGEREQLLHAAIADIPG